MLQKYFVNAALILWKLKLSHYGPRVEAAVSSAYGSSSEDGPCIISGVYWHKNYFSLKRALALVRQVISRYLISTSFIQIFPSLRQVIISPKVL